MLACHIAFNVTSSAGIVSGNSGFHHLNVYHDNSGSDTPPTSAQYLPVIGATSVHVDVSNEISYIFLS